MTTLLISLLGFLLAGAVQETELPPSPEPPLVFLPIGVDAPQANELNLSFFVRVGEHEDDKHLYLLVHNPNGALILFPFVEIRLDEQVIFTNRIRNLDPNSVTLFRLTPDEPLDLSIPPPQFPGDYAASAPTTKPSWERLRVSVFKGSIK